MKSKTTWIWFTVAATLFAFIVVWNHFQRQQTVPSFAVLPEFQPAAVTSLQIIPANAFEIRVENKDGSWSLTKPVSYPAQAAAIQALLDSLQKLTFVTRIGAAELREHKDSEAEFGFDNPQLSLVIEAGDQSWQLKVGNRTAPGDQVFLRIIGVEGIFVTDASWLNYIPHSAADWRDTSLVIAGGNHFDAIVLTNNSKGLVIELRQDATNHLWRMIRPLQARADTMRINAALQQLQAARVTQFVTDDPNADLAAFGLQPPEMDLWLGHCTNLLAGIRAGKSPANDASRVYAKRKGWNTVVTTAKELLAAWYGAVNNFRDPNLMEFTAPANEIEVRGENNFILQRQGSNDWKIAGEKFAANAGNVQSFIKILASLRVEDFMKDVANASDLQAYGLAVPSREIIVRSTAGDTNSVIADLSFAVTTNGIFAHRADEDSIYSVSKSDLSRLPEFGWEFRDRDIWHFSEDDVAQITLHQNGKTRVLVHNGQNKWSLGPGSQGVINPPAIEETAHRFGELSAEPYGWVGRNAIEPDRYGWSTNNLQAVFELKGGDKLSVDFGAELEQAHTALAAVTLDGERWAFIFPPVLYQFVLSYLAIPANVP